MRNLPVGETERLGFGQQFSVKWRHRRNSRPEIFRVSSGECDADGMVWRKMDADGDGITNS